MKRPKTVALGRPAMGYLSGIQSSREAAIQLVRLEFDLDRLSAGIAQSQSRVAAYRNEQAECLRQKARLLEVISATEEQAGDGT